MGSRLSPVAACLFMEMLEDEEFSKIMSEDIKWFRYVDDVVLITPVDTNLQETLASLNRAHERIQFTLEEQKDKMLSFLDISIIIEDKCSVYSVSEANQQGELHSLLLFTQHENKVG